MTNGNESAFPAQQFTGSTKGLTKREYFAAMTMQGLCASPYSSSNEDNAKEAVGAADALITALSNTDNQGG